MGVVHPNSVTRVQNLEFAQRSLTFVWQNLEFVRRGLEFAQANLEFAQRVILGYEGDEGGGVQVRWFTFDNVLGTQD